MQKTTNPIPASVVLSWHSIQIIAEQRKIIDLIPGIRRPRQYQTILENLNGFVLPGELLALMGPRLVVVPLLNKFAFFNNHPI